MTLDRGLRGGATKWEEIETKEDDVRPCHFFLGVRRMIRALI